MTYFTSVTASEPKPIPRLHLFWVCEPKRQGMKISCIEEIAFRMGYIDKAQLEILGNNMGNNPYGQYLIKIVKENL